MPLVSTSVAASGIAAKKIIESLAVDLYTTAKSELGDKLKKWKASSHVDAVWKRVRQLRLVKTIWQIEKEVDLTTFYYPAKVHIGKKRRSVHELAVFQHEGSILIEGTVGQGKSILLRYLASTDVFISKRVPVFLELRRLRAGQSIASLALDELKALGFEWSEEMFHFFASKGKLTLFLDAFDEVKEELRSEAIAEIEGLLRRHDKLRAIVTSRPESGIASSAMFHVFKISHLEGTEYEEVIRRITHDPRVADQIILGIAKEEKGLGDVLDTPLMVSLLLVRYRIDQSLPENQSAFYEALFTLLLQRHDKAKGGYVRPRKSGLSDGALLEFFNALSFVTRKAGETSFSRVQLNKFAREALSIIAKAAEVDSVLADIIDISCLILSDGHECKFVHKSVQEYHAGLFISEQPDEIAKAFYVAMHERWRHWVQDIEFLMCIDRYRSLRDFHIPSIRALLEVDKALPANWTPNRELIHRIFGDDRLEFDAHGSGCTLTYLSSGSFWPTHRLFFVSHHYDYAHSLLRIVRQDMGETDESGKPSRKSVSELLELASYSESVERLCVTVLKKIMAELRDSEAHVQSVENRKRVLSF